MNPSPTLPGSLSRLAAYEKAALALSVLACAFLIIDPLVLGVVREFDPGTRNFFRGLTYLGKSNWILVLSGALILLFTWLGAKQASRRSNAAYRLAQQLLLFLFSTVALSGLGVSLLKNILDEEGHPIHLAFQMLSYLPWLFWQIVLANIDVAYRVLHPALPINPGIVKVKTNLKSDTALTFLANSITLTPGTLSVDIDKDKGFLYIHWIDVKAKDVEAATKIIADIFEYTHLRNTSVRLFGFHG